MIVPQCREETLRTRPEAEGCGAREPLVLRRSRVDSPIGKIGRDYGSESTKDQCDSSPCTKDRALFTRVGTYKFLFMGRKL